MLIGPSHRALHHRRRRSPVRRSSSAPTSSHAPSPRRPRCRSACSPRSSAARSSSGSCAGPAPSRAAGHEAARRGLRTADHVHCPARRFAAASRRQCAARLARGSCDAVDIAAHAGEVLALVGPNGAGKSTLLGALSGDLPVVGGSVHIDGQPLAAWSGRELAMRRAVLPQQSIGQLSRSRSTRSSAWVAHRGPAPTRTRSTTRLSPR